MLYGAVEEDVALGNVAELLVEGERVELRFEDELGETVFTGGLLDAAHQQSSNSAPPMLDQDSHPPDFADAMSFVDEPRRPDYSGRVLLASEACDEMQRGDVVGVKLLLGRHRLLLHEDFHADCKGGFTLRRGDDRRSLIRWYSKGSMLLIHARRFFTPPLVSSVRVMIWRKHLAGKKRN